MKAIFGFGMSVIAAVLAATPLFAQSAPAEPQQDTVGPSELRDFSLPGTRGPAQPEPRTDVPPVSAPARPQARPSAPADRQTQTPRSQPTVPAVALQAQPEREADARQEESEAQPSPAPESQPVEAAPEPASGGDFFSQPVPGPIPVPPEATAPVAQNSFDLLPWFILALLAAAAAAYFLFRHRSRPERPQIAARQVPVAAGAAPLSPPAPAPEPAPVNVPASSGGVVSARLRPSLELMLTPLRCVIDDKQATIEFTITALNSGNAPARDVRIEVALINAGPAQDQEIGRFFEQPAGVGEPLEIIPPMRSIQLSSRVSLPLAQVRSIEAAGRRLFVPLLAFNALFRWSGGSGQTSQSYLIGREGEGEKMSPFRLDLGPRVFRNLGARPHHMQVRR